MKTICLCAMTLIVMACATHTPRCDGKLQPINPPSRPAAAQPSEPAAVHP